MLPLDLVATSPGRDPPSGIIPSATGRGDEVRASWRQDDRAGRWLLIAVALGGALRLCWVVAAFEEPPFISDPQSYVTLGQSIASGDGYVSFFYREPSAFFPPGFPFILGATFWVIEWLPFEVSPFHSAAALNVLAGTATVALVGVVGRCLFGARAGLLAAFTIAMFPGLVYYTADAHLETVFIFLVVLTLALLAPALAERDELARRRLLVSGAVLALSVMVRPLTMFLIPLLALVGWRAGWGWRRSVVAASWMTLPLLALVVPWTVRNAVVLDAFVPLSTNAGDTLCIDHHSGSGGDFASGAGYCLEGFEGVPRKRLEVVRNQQNTERAVRFLASDPLRELRHIPQRLRLSIAHGHEGLPATRGRSEAVGPLRPPLLRAAADIPFFVTLGLGAVGVLALLRGDRPERLFVLGTVLCLLSAPLGLYGYTRFWAPLLPFQILLASNALIVLIGMLSAASGRSSPGSSSGPLLSHVRRQG